VQASVLYDIVLRSSWYMYNTNEFMQMLKRKRRLSPFFRSAIDTWDGSAIVTIWTFRWNRFLRSPKIAFLVLLVNRRKIVYRPLVETILVPVFSQRRASTELDFVGVETTRKLSGQPVQRDMWRVQMHRDALPVELNVSTCCEQEDVRKVHRFLDGTKTRFGRDIYGF